MGTVGQKIQRRGKTGAATFAVELSDAHGQFDGPASDRQVQDPFAIAALLDALAGLATMRTNADLVTRSHCEAMPIVVSIVVVVNHDESRQVEEFRPKAECGYACHDYAREGSR
jgi:hypothetical protein